MTERAPTAAELARVLHQAAEMGHAELFLGRMTRAEALSLARAAREDVGPAGAAPPSVRSKAEGEPTEGAPRAKSGRATRPVEGTAVPGGASAPTRSEALAPPEGAGAALPVLPDDYQALRDLALTCTRCRLASDRKTVVFADGPPDARLMVVGEAPGANEDETGLPFVGAAGKFLDLLLATVGLSREESVYIANVLKCRPPGNRDPLPDEIEACSPYLLKQIDLVKPQALLAVGSFSGKLLTGQPNAALGKLRGSVHAYHGVPLVVTYHPAALLRNATWTRAFWDDLQLLRQVLDGS